MNNNKKLIIIFILFITFYLDLISAQGQDNPYKILGIGKNANEKTIKKAFKQLSLKYHPDKNRDPKAIEYYSKIVNAYETLIDPNKKQQYDLYGTTD